jgi:hypothetical protein
MNALEIKCCALLDPVPLCRPRYEKVTIYKRVPCVPFHLCSFVYLAELVTYEQNFPRLVGSMYIDKSHVGDVLLEKFKTEFKADFFNDERNDTAELLSALSGQVEQQLYNCTLQPQQVIFFCDLPIGEDKWDVMYELRSRMYIC